jgi:ATP-dependent DNA ligase
MRASTFVPPQFPSLATAAPTGTEWLHEIKHDGFRTCITIHHSEVRAFTRAGHDWSDRYRPIVKACRALTCRAATIDGEVVVEDERGVSDFDALHECIEHHPERLAFFAFDLLALDAGTCGRGL